LFTVCLDSYYYKLGGWGAGKGEGKGEGKGKGKGKGMGEYLIWPELTSFLFNVYGKRERERR